MLRCGWNFCTLHVETGLLDLRIRKTQSGVPNYLRPKQVDVQAVKIFRNLHALALSYVIGILIIFVYLQTAPQLWYILSQTSLHIQVANPMAHD